MRRATVVLSFATLCFANTWVQLAGGKVSYFSRYDPRTASALPAAAWEILIAASIFAIWQFHRRRGVPGASTLERLFAIACAAPLGIIATLLVQFLPSPTRPRLLILFAPLVLIAIVFLFIRPFVIGRLLRKLLFWASPALLVLLFQACYQTLFRFSESQYADKPPAAAFPNPPDRRVVWVIFDELSQAVTFSNRPANLQLPQFDLLRRTAFYATAARSPDNSTELSMPALIPGEDVTDAQPEGPDRLLLKTASRSDSFAWNSARNIFDDVRARRLNTAIVGWYHPYCRELYRSLTRCEWMAGWLAPGVEEESPQPSFARSMIDRIRFQAGNLPLAGHLPFLSPQIAQRAAQRDRFLELKKRAFDAAADPSLGLTLIHLPVPHPPAIYDRAAQALNIRQPRSYVDSVALADEVLGELRKRIADAGLADRTALIVSADHGWRVNLWRSTPEWTAEDEAASHVDTSGIPFLVSMPGESSGLVYAKPFDTAITSRLIAGIIDGRITSSSSLAAATDELSRVP